MDRPFTRDARDAEARRGMTVRHSCRLYHARNKATPVMDRGGEKRLAIPRVALASYFRSVFVDEAAPALPAPMIADDWKSVASPAGFARRAPISASPSTSARLLPN